ncbi:protein phosphatase 1 regulatory subunit 36-like [Dysidea avara]|uniref:protein phosphatase 1 regulatory subunit 36-like n=1 Tax=Dysidea avara TaxID=196820 RepID=UPI003325E0DB
MALTSRQINQQFTISSPALMKPVSGIKSVYKGEWVWNEVTQDIHFVSKDGGCISYRGIRKKPITRHTSRKQLPPPVSNGDVQDHSVPDDEVDRVTSSKQAALDHSGMSSGRKTTSKAETIEEQLVSLDDVKSVAVGMIADKVVRKMSQQSIQLFDTCYRSEQVDTYLWDTIVYFSRYLVVRELEMDKNLTMPGDLGRKVRESLKKAKRSQSVAINKLAQSYSVLILAIGLDDQHHSMKGRLQASRSKLDLELFEAIYEFVFYVTWITLHKRHWELIHDELGRIFRTDAFRSVCPSLEMVSSSHNITKHETTELSGSTDNGDLVITEEDELNLLGVKTPGQSRRPSVKSTRSTKSATHYDRHCSKSKRPPVGSLGNLRSPIIVSLLPNSVEHASVLLVTPQELEDDNCESHIGIIGKPLSKFDTESLTEINNDDDDDDDDDGETSVVSCRAKSSAT